MSFDELLKHMVAQEASDLYLSAGAPASIKVHGRLLPVNDDNLSCETITDYALAIMDKTQQQRFNESLEMNLAISRNGVGRFRVNIFKQRNHVALVIRNIKTEIPAYDTLGIPEQLTNLVMEKRGLLLFVGATGTGKSTTLASLLDHRNTHHAGHIITIEDPIEFLHRHKKSIVNQREVGIDTLSYEEALRNTFRQAPDVILIGEIRTQETMQHAISFAETGHLCISTLHANNANQALDRIINFFPPDKRQQLLLDLSLNLRGIISQRLIPSIDGKRHAVFEILLNSPLVSDVIHRGDIYALKDIMQKSESTGMQTFDTALYMAYQQGHITVEEALRNADSHNNLRLRISLQAGVDTQSVDFDLEHPIDDRIAHNMAHALQKKRPSDPTRLDSTDN